MLLKSFQVKIVALLHTVVKINSNTFVISDSVKNKVASEISLTEEKRNIIGKGRKT